MESANSNIVKEKFKDFSKEKKYVYHESDPLIAKSSSKLLFNISGGVKYQDELLELKQAAEKKVSSIQECVRTDGMKSIGYSGRHHLYFEMLGHFIFYSMPEKETKEEFIKFAYDFLVKEIGLSQKRIYATVHPNDLVTLEIWNKIGNKNIILSDSNIFVSPYADKSSLRTEIKWQKNDEENSLVELWNLVFTQFNSKNLFENPSKTVGADSGASLERIVSAYENKNNNYENSMWSGYVNYLQSLSKEGQINDYRRLADFFNTSAKMIDAGIEPGNKVQPYMLRKIIRTIFDICDKLDLNIEDFISEYYKYNKMNISQKELLKIYQEELIKYYNTIKNGLAQANKLLAKTDRDNLNFEYLRSTCGLPERYIDDILSNHEVVLSKKLFK